MTTSHRASRIVISAPMSFSGSAARISNAVQRVTNPAVRGFLAWPAAVLAIVIVWALVLCWYAMFGLLLVPYRLVRRGSRKRKAADRQHAELMAALARNAVGIE